MADEVEFKVDTSALDAALQKLPERVQKRIIRNALQSAGDVMLDAMKAHTPERTDDENPESTSLPPGIMREDMHTDILVSETKGARLRVGPTEVSGHVARWVNNGWTLTKKTKSGKRKIKDIPGQHFMEAAFDESSEQALGVFIATLAKGLTEENEGSDE